MFLQPTTIAPNTKQLTLRSASDSAIVVFGATNYQPTFLQNDKDTIRYDYTIESMVFESSNGNKLNGWMLKPKSITPTITLLHYHGNAGFLVSQYQRMSPLLQHGFQVFMFDYSGYGFSTGDASRKNVLIDANSALSYVKNRADVKGTRLVVYGQSLGGHLAGVVASQRQDEIDGAVIEGAFSSHKDIAAETAGFFGRTFVSEKYSAVKSIPHFKKPLLVIHSTEDKVIPFKMGRKLFDNARSPKEFMEIKECHICGPQFYAEAIATKIKAMVK